MTDSIDIDAVCEGIQTVSQTITGIGTCYATPPVTLETAQLPASYPLTGTAQYELMSGGEDGNYENRLYRVQFPVLPENQANAQLREERCRPLIQAAIKAFMGHPSLAGTRNVQEAVVLGDSGIVILPEYDGKYIGFELRVAVRFLISRSFADYE